MSARPHEHYYFDQVGRAIYVVVCATCGDTVGTVPDTGDSYLPFAQQHWEEEVLYARPRATC